MTRKAKKVKKSKRKTRRDIALEAIKCEAHNNKGLAEHYSAKIVKLETRLETVEKELAASRDSTLHKTNEILRRGEVINDLKQIIAGLEKNCAENLGTIRALNRQIDQAAPKVEVVPARMLSPLEAQQFHRDPGGMFAAEVEKLGHAEMRTKKHWTAL